MLHLVSEYSDPRLNSKILTTASAINNTHTDGDLVESEGSFVYLGSWQPSVFQWLFPSTLDAPLCFPSLTNGVRLWAEFGKTRLVQVPHCQCRWSKKCLNFLAACFPSGLHAGS